MLEKNGKPKEEEGALVTEADPRYFQSASLGHRRRRVQRGGEHVLQPRPQRQGTEEADAENIKAYLELNKPYDPGLTVAKIPVDAVNTSASNLDPEISQANAWIQAHRDRGRAPALAERRSTA